MRPPGFALGMSLLTGRKDFPCSIEVRLLSPKSAEPPQSSGSTAAMALIVSPDAFRVATDEPGSNLGMAVCQLIGSARANNRWYNAADSGFAFDHEASCLFQLP